MFVGPCIIVITEEKNQLDATYYFIVLLIGWTCFGHYYAHHQELSTIMLITTFGPLFLVCFERRYWLLILNRVSDLWMNMEHWRNDRERGNRRGREKPLPVPLCSPHKSHGLQTLRKMVMPSNFEVSESKNWSSVTTLYIGRLESSSPLL